MHEEHGRSFLDAQLFLRSTNWFHTLKSTCNVRIAPVLCVKIPFDNCVAKLSEGTSTKFRAFPVWRAEEIGMKAEEVGEPVLDLSLEERQCCYSASERRKGNSPLQRLSRHMTLPSGSHASSCEDCQPRFTKLRQRLYSRMRCEQMPLGMNTLQDFRRDLPGSCPVLAIWAVDEESCCRIVGFELG